MAVAGQLFQADRFSWWKLFVLACGAYIFYGCALVIYRLFFSPIARFPGSKLTAATGWYETYYDVFKGGQFIFEIEKWHRRYGRIIRINPWEVHIADPDFYESLYTTKSRYDKLEKLRYRFGLHLSSFDTISHDHHHRRRSAIGQFFSRQKVIEFSPYIQGLANKMCDRLQSEFGMRKKVVNMNEAYAAFVSDAINYYTFAISYEFLDYPDFITPFTTSIRKLAFSLHVAGHFPWFLSLMQSLPERTVAVMNPLLVPVFQFHNEVKTQIVKVLNGQNVSDKVAAHKTVFHNLLQSDLPPEELTVERLKHEAASITGAGIDTTKTTLALATFHILDNPRIIKRLKKELKDGIPDPSLMPSVPDLEKLTYLNAIVQEALRMSFGISQRLSRINPHGPILYGDFVIPANVPFGMTSYLQHRDAHIFPDPDNFLPERWLGDTKTASGKPLVRYLVPFGRGPRMCMGMNFAITELYIGLATVFRRLNLELYDTERDAVDMAADFFVPIPKSGTRGVEVLVV